MIKTFKYLKPYLLVIIFIFILTALRSYLNLVLPNYMRDMLNDIEYYTGNQAAQRHAIWTNTLWMGLNTLGAVLLVMVSGFFEARVSSGYGKRLRSAVYQKIETFSNFEMDQFTTSSLITRTTNDIALIQGTMMLMLRMVILLPFLSIGAILMAISISPQLSTILIFSILAVFAIVGTVIVIVMPKFKIIQKLIDRLNLVTRENLSGLKVVRAYNTQTAQAQKIKTAAQDNMKMGIFVNRVNSLIWPVMGIVMALTSVGIAFFANRWGLVGNGGLTGGDLSAMIQYAMQTIMSFMMITMILMMLPRALVSAKRVMEVLECDPSIKDIEGATVIPELVIGEITFENVSFGYNDSDEKVLSNISFVAKPNQTTAIIGSTGTGKSTLINLVPRFYEPTSGRILLDGVDIRHYQQDSYLQVIGYVPQKANLFKGTISSNIAFGNENIDLPSLERAASIAQAQEFIDQLDEKYDYLINQGGSNVSGGQRQRLSIARALAKDPKIYIFDDSFSALDYKTDQKLRKALKDNVKATILIVAQRINTIRHADQIVVLDQGKIVGIGQHDELINTCSVYQEIASSQLSLEEVYNA